MKKTYLNPELDILCFDSEVRTDIISSSSQAQGEDNIRLYWD